jgi:glycosyltransferase involved in cell wall biosynthesis
MPLNLSKLPKPPPGKKGWPWSIESEQIPPVMPNGKAWPKISIVTPSYNQGHFIEETIRSVLLQNYPNLEYIIIDGGSTDNTIDVIKKYESWITYWESKKDKGQSNALNIGFSKSTGDILNWLCSDDIYMPSAFFEIAAYMQLDFPLWIIGKAYTINSASKKIKINNNNLKEINLNTFLSWRVFGFSQAATFWNRMMWEKGQKINENLHYCMDTDLWFKFYNFSKPLALDVFLASYRLHSEAKTSISSVSFEDALLELCDWILGQILYLGNDRKIHDEILNAIVLIQKDIEAYKRIKEHIIFSKLLRFWKLNINPNILL